MCEAIFQIEWLIKDTSYEILPIAEANAEFPRSFGWWENWEQFLSLVFCSILWLRSMIAISIDGQIIKI